MGKPFVGWTRVRPRSWRRDNDPAQGSRSGILLGPNVYHMDALHEYLQKEIPAHHPSKTPMFNSHFGISAVKNSLFSSRNSCNFMQKHHFQATGRKRQSSFVFLLTFLSLWTPVYLKNLTLKLASNAPFKSQWEALCWLLFSESL